MTSRYPVKGKFLPSVSEFAFILINVCFQQVIHLCSRMFRSLWVSPADQRRSTRNTVSQERERDRLDDSCFPAISFFFYMESLFLYRESFLESIDDAFLPPPVLTSYLGYFLARRKPHMIATAIPAAPTRVAGVNH